MPPAWSEKRYTETELPDVETIMVWLTARDLEYEGKFNFKCGRHCIERSGKLPLDLRHVSRLFAHILAKTVAGEHRMEDRIEELRAEFVGLLQKQVEALELETYVGLSDVERREYYKRQERIRDLDAEMSRFCSSAA